MDIIQQDIKKLQHDVQQLTKAVQNLTQVCSQMDKSSKKMGDHIDFVEATYETVRSPLTYISNRVNQLRGLEQNDLPRLKNGK